VPIPPPRGGVGATASGNGRLSQSENEPCLMRPTPRNKRPSPHAKKHLVVTQRRALEKKLSAPAQRPRAATCRRYQPRVVARKPRRSGRFRRLGRATGSGRASANLPLRPRDRSGVCLRHGLRSARFAVCLRQRAQPAAYANARPVAAQPFRRARPPRHALTAASAPYALGLPR
jgi:hypothetical protein